MRVEKSRTAQSARNATVSALAQVVVVALGLVTRTVFIAQLGVAMVGVNAVLISIVALLAFADLGISGAVMFSLYKPLSTDDTETIAAIVRFAGTVFRWVALTVGVIGMALTPFVHEFVRLDGSVEHLELYYLVLLANTVAGYLMLNRVVLLNADQKVHITTAYSLLFNTFRSVAQIVSLMVYGSFLLFLVIQVSFTVFNNVAVYFQAGRLYPHIKSRSAAITASERRSLLSSVKAMLVYRIGGLLLINSTPVLVSVIVGTVALGYYSNYMLVVGAAVMIIEVVFSALVPSVGSLIASGNLNSARGVFDEMVLLSVLVHGALSVVLITVIDDFMTLWLGSEYVLPTEVVVVIVLNFYVAGTLLPLLSFRNATGLFHRTKMFFLFTAAISIVLSFAFGVVFGLAGVLVAPIVARLMTLAWYEPWILIREYLSGKVSTYFAFQFGALLSWIATAIVVIEVSELVPGGLGAELMTKAALLIVVVPAVSWLVFGRTKAFLALAQRSRSLFLRTQRG